MAGVLFATGKYDLRPEAQMRLARLAGYSASSLPGLVAERLSPGISGRRARRLDGVALQAALQNYRKAVEGGLLKVYLSQRFQVKKKITAAAPKCPSGWKKVA